MILEKVVLDTIKNKKIKNFWKGVKRSKIINRSREELNKINLFRLQLNNKESSKTKILLIFESSCLVRRTFSRKTLNYT